VIARRNVSAPTMIFQFNAVLPASLRLWSRLASVSKPERSVPVYQGSVNKTWAMTLTESLFPSVYLILSNLAFFMSIFILFVTFLAVLCNLTQPFIMFCLRCTKMPMLTSWLISKISVHARAIFFILWSAKIGLLRIIFYFHTNTPTLSIAAAIICII